MPKVPFTNEWAEIFFIIETDESEYGLLSGGKSGEARIYTKNVYF
jgi:hypothetical protein